MADTSPSATYGGILGMDDALVSGAGNPALSMISGDWLGTGMQILGGIFGGSSTKVSKSQTAAQGLLNTSGWATGDSSAEGANLSSSQILGMQGMNDWPWYYWAAGTVIAVALIKKAV